MKRESNDLKEELYQMLAEEFGFHEQ